MSWDSDSHLLKIKQEVASSDPDFQVRVTQAWAEIIEELSKATEAIAKQGTDVSTYSTLWTPGLIKVFSTYLKSTLPTCQAAYQARN